MAIEHSEAAQELERFFQSMEKKLIEFPVISKPVYAKPLTCEQVDILNKYNGHVYNVRLLIASLVYEDGKKVFREEDVVTLMKTDPGSIGRAALQIGTHIATSFDSIKN